MKLATLGEAIEWASSRWSNQRTPPLRLHKRETEGVGPFYSDAFAAALDGSLYASSSAPSTVKCWHPLLNRNAVAHDCPECFGTGLKDVRVDRYLYPMSIAILKLRNSLGPARQEHPAILVVALASHHWDARDAAASLGYGWDYAEAVFLQAIRRLHGFYAEGPVSTRTSGPSWVDKSDSQRAAETAETAA